MSRQTRRCPALIFPPRRRGGLTSAEIAWIRQFGTADTDELTGVAADASGLYVSGFTRGALPGQNSAGVADAFLRKYDVGGNEIWTRQFGSTVNDGTTDVAIDSSGVYVVGVTDGVLPGQTSAGSTDAFVRKYDFDGNEIWTRQFGTSGRDGYFGGLWPCCVNAAVDASGVYVAGITTGMFPGQTAGNWFVRKYDAAGNEVWTRQSSLDGDAQGFTVGPAGMYVVGDDGLGAYVFLSKLDLSGNVVWTRRIDSGGGDYGGSVAVNPSGIYVAGRASSALPGQATGGVFIRKYDDSGSETWTRQFASDSTYIRANYPRIPVDASGVYVAGTTTLALPGQTSAGGDDVFVRKYDADGNELWTNQFGSSAIDESLGAAIHGSDFFVAGRTSGMLPGQTSAGGWDAFVTRFVEGPIPLSATADANPNNGPAPLTVSFTGIASGGTPPYAYAWQFGDGGSSTQQDPFHTYQNARTYTATLTVTDSASRPASDSVAITVTPAPNSPPTLDPIESVPAYTIPGQEVRLTASASDPDGDVLTYAWDFGDGGSATGATTAGGGMITATHVYGAARTYSVGLTIDDGRRGTAARSATVRVVAPPAVDMSAQTSSGTVPLTVRFGATPSGGISPYSFRWDFRDGTFSTDQNPIHTYQAAGTYTVTLTVTDAAGFRATRTIPITASPGPSWIPYGFIAVIVAVAIAITAFWRHRRRARSPPAAFPKLGNVIGAEEGRSTSTQGPNEEVKT